MLIVLSPAKKLDPEPSRDRPMTEPVFAGDAVRLAEEARRLSADDLRRLMGLSDALGRLNADRFRDFKASPGAEALSPAALTFAGDTYQGLWARDFSDADWAEAQARLRVLSGLYGLLRPLDGIQPHRLEMGTKLKTDRGRDLYDYWGDAVAEELNSAAEAFGTDTLLNCASQEYFRVADRDALKLRVVSPVFLEERDGEGKVISFFAKRARGALARFVLKNGIRDIEDLKLFDGLGYRYKADLSEPGRPVYWRAGPGT